jgi:hypothetical protein
VSVGRRVRASKANDALMPGSKGYAAAAVGGSEDHVRAFLGDNVTDGELHRQAVHVDRLANPNEFRDYFKANYGPTIAA